MVFLLEDLKIIIISLWVDSVFSGALLQQYLFENNNEQTLVSNNKKQSLKSKSINLGPPSKNLVEFSLISSQSWSHGPYTEWISHVAENKLENVILILKPGGALVKSDK